MIYQISTTLLVHESFLYSSWKGLEALGSPKKSVATKQGYFVWEHPSHQDAVSALDSIWIHAERSRACMHESAFVHK